MICRWPTFRHPAGLPHQKQDSSTKTPLEIDCHNCGAALVEARPCQTSEDRAVGRRGARRSGAGSNRRCAEMPRPHPIDLGRVLPSEHGHAGGSNRSRSDAVLGSSGAQRSHCSTPRSSTPDRGSVTLGRLGDPRLRITELLAKRRRRRGSPQVAGGPFIAASLSTPARRRRCSGPACKGREIPSTLRLNESSIAPLSRTGRLLEERRAPTSTKAVMRPLLLYEEFVELAHADRRTLIRRDHEREVELDRRERNTGSGRWW